MLEAVDGLCVVGEAESPAQAVAGISATRPDCVVLDFQLIGGTAVDVLRAVHPVSPEIAFIVLTNHPTSQYRRACMDAGAIGFLDKSTEFGKLKAAVAECIRRGIDAANPSLRQIMITVTDEGDDMQAAAT